MNRTAGRCCYTLCLVFSMALMQQACQDSSVLVSPTPSPSSAVAFLELEETGISTQFILRGRVRVGKGLSLPAAFVARVVLPPGVDAGPDVGSVGSMLRAVTVVDQEVRIAGASPSGIEELFSISLRSTSRELIESTRLVIDELTDQRGNDLRVILRTASRPLDARRQ